MKGKKILLLLVAMLLMFGIGTAVAGVIPQDLQPTFRLMNDEVELGVAYGLDYGWVIMTEEATLYVCGCGKPEVVIETVYSEGEVEYITEYVETACTEEPKSNSGRGNGSEGNPDSDPGNSGDSNQGGD